MHQPPDLLGPADGTYRERWSLVLSALARVGADLHLVQLCRLVFEGTHGGQAGELRQSARELATIDALACSPRKAQMTIAKAVAAGLVTAAAEVTTSGQQSNRYTINWPAIRRLLGIREAAGTPTEPEADTTQETLRTPCAPLRTPYVPLRTPCAPLRTPCAVYKEYRSIDFDRQTDDVVVCQHQLSEADRQEIYTAAGRLWSEACDRRRLEPTERRLLFAAAALVHVGRLSPAWLDNARQATRRRKAANPVGYLRRCLQTGLAEIEGLCAVDEGPTTLNQLLRWIDPQAAASDIDQTTPHTTQEETPYGHDQQEPAGSTATQGRS